VNCRGSLTPAVRMHPINGAGECAICGRRFDRRDLVDFRWGPRGVIPRHPDPTWSGAVLRAGPV
jgi:hypothetical protein